MSPAQLEELERALGLTLPQEYRAALLEYPLPRDPHSTELWLSDDHAELRELNRGWHAEGHARHTILIGSDGGEESYVLDTSQAPFPVLAYSSETGRLEDYADSFASFLARQRREYEEIEADRRRMQEAYAKKRWWQFWIRPYAGLVLLLGSTLAGPVLYAQTAPTDSAAIHGLARRFSAAYVRGDASAMADLYTADGVIFPEQSEWISGREAIARYWTPRPGSRVTRHVVTPSRVVVDGRHAYDYGTFEIAGERDGKAWGPFRGKYVVVWRREQGGWRMQLDIWNSGPAPEP